MKGAVPLFLVFCSYLGATAQEHEAGAKKVQGDTVFIDGRIKLSRNQPHSMEFVAANYILGTPITHYTSIDNDGRFQIKFFIRNSLDVYWRYSDHASFGMLLLSPGDSLTIDARDGGIQFSGKNAAASEDVQNMRTRDERMAYFYELEKGYSLEPEEYLKFRKTQFEKDVKFLTDYCSTRNCTPLFRQWYLSNSEVRYFTDLMNFSWKSLNYGLGSPVRLTGERKLKYDSAFFNDINFDDTTYTMSSAYSMLLGGISNKYHRGSDAAKESQIARLKFLLDFASRKLSFELKDESGSDIKTLNALLMKAEAGEQPDSIENRVLWKISERYELPLQRAMEAWSINRNIGNMSKIQHAKTRDLVLGHQFIRALETTTNPDLYYGSMVDPLIETLEYKEAFTVEYEKIRSLDTLIKNSGGIEIIPRNYEKTGNQLLSEIIRSTPGKVILLDFWATWCFPCLQDFKAMHKIKGRLPDDSISYVYLCAKSPRESWIKQIKRHNIKGQHYFVSETQYNDLQNKYNLNVFPTYLIIDRRKRIHKNISIRDEELFIENVQKIMRAE